jgi:hypothetical protein
MNRKLKITLNLLKILQRLVANRCRQVSLLKHYFQLICARKFLLQIVFLEKKNDVDKESIEGGRVNDEVCVIGNQNSIEKSFVATFFFDFFFDLLLFFVVAMTIKEISFNHVHRML